MGYWNFSTPDQSINQSITEGAFVLRVGGGNLMKLWISVEKVLSLSTYNGHICSNIKIGSIPPPRPPPSEPPFGFEHYRMSNFHSYVLFYWSWLHFHSPTEPRKYWYIWEEMPRFLVKRKGSYLPYKMNRLRNWFNWLGFSHPTPKSTRKCCFLFVNFKKKTIKKIVGKKKTTQKMVVFCWLINFC